MTPEKLMRIASPYYDGLANELAIAHTIYVESFNQSKKRLNERLHAAQKLKADLLDALDDAHMRALSLQWGASDEEKKAFRESHEARRTGHLKELEATCNAIWTDHTFESEAFYAEYAVKRDEAIAHMNNEIARSIERGES